MDAVKIGSAASALFAALVLSACGNDKGIPEGPAVGNEVKVYDKAVLESGVRSILVDKYNIENVDNVECPPRQEVRSGQGFKCVVDIDGSTKQVAVTIRTDDGEYEVAPPA
ncbi:DUF4333 domain-containing protein [Actinokineospora sp. HUAS TT18]|uniref:DUF4333 domain-containing protein n=1 Tax=Actinokineospora sp. HUAS TT18 TaxID=3447451 RepID=UPI003F525319